MRSKNNSITFLLCIFTISTLHLFGAKQHDLQFSDTVSQQLLDAIHKDVDNTEAIENLLTHGANPNVRNKSGQTPLHLALIVRFEVMIRSPDEVNSDIQNEQLSAMNRGNHNAVKLLLARGANPNVQDNHGWTPLHLAVENRYSQSVITLLAHGADANKEDKQKQVPLDIARKKGYAEIEEAFKRVMVDIKPAKR